MKISLTPEQEKFVSEKVESGFYNSASEVIRQALRLLAKEEAEHEAQLESLREAIQKGLDSGPAKPWDLKSFLKQAHQK